MSANVNTPAAPVAPVAQPAAAPKTPVTPTAAPATPAAGGREAEYQAALAAARGEQGPPTLSKAAQRMEAEAKAAAEGVDLGDESEGEGDQVEVGDENVETTEETAATHEPKLEKFKVNGKEIEIDLADTEAVKVHVQKGLAAEEKFQHAAKIQRSAEAFIGTLRDNPFAALQNPKLGIPKEVLRQQAERYLYDIVKFETATPEQQVAIKEKAELEQRRAAEQSTKTRAEAKRRQELKENYQKDMSAQFLEVLNTSAVPVTDYTVQRMAFYMRAALKRGMKTIKPADVVPLVKRDWETTFKQLTSHLDGEKLIAQFGEEAVAKMRKAALNKSRGDGNAAPRPVANPAPRAAKRPTPTTTYNSAEEMRDAMVANARRGG